MQIPPIDLSTNSASYFKGDPIVDKFNALWDQWYNDPTRDTGNTLLDYIKDHHQHFAKLAEKTPLPHPRVSFDLSMSAAETSLQGWLDHGCPSNITGISQFVADVAKWINYAR